MRILLVPQGIFSTIASGEGLVSRFQGPGRIWIQTRNIFAFAQLLFPFSQNKSEIFLEPKPNFI